MFEVSQRALDLMDEQREYDMSRRYPRKEFDGNVGFNNFFGEYDGYAPENMGY